MSAASHLPEQSLWRLFDMSPLSSSGLEGYLNVSLGRCAEWFRASGGSIFLNFEGGETFFVRSRYGRQIKLPSDSSFKLGEGIAGLVAESGVARIIDNPSDDPELAHRGVHFKESIASSMVIPLLTPERRTMGVLNVSRARGEISFDNGDLLQAETLASHVALAVSNAQMITGLRAQMEESRLTSEKLLAVLDSVAGAVVVVDASGEVVNHNEAAAKQSFTGPWHAQEGSVLRENLSEITGSVLQQHLSARRRAYDPVSDRSWLMEALPLSSGGAVITVRETTEMERQQRDIDRVKRLAEIGQMTAAIAHEIRNPLTGIRSAAQMMSEHPDMSGECRAMIDEEVMKLNDLCEEFLDFARPLTVNLCETHLPDLIQKVCGQMRLEFAEMGAVLRYDSPPHQPTILVDARRVEQVAYNLIRNGLQSTTSDGEVWVRADGNSFQVRDNGVGLTEDQLGRLFSPFFTTKASGTGLGLCNVRKIIDAHGGSIKVESELGHGACFEVCFERIKE